VVYIPSYFRIVRGQALSLREQTFVEAARSLGAGHRDIIWMYILPNVLPSILVVSTLNIADAIITEAGLSFLGLGITPPTPDWGLDLNDGKRYYLSGAWWLGAFPGLMIVITVLGFSLLGEGLNEKFNPKLRGG
jgi:peptide/nickel transport system permease protein